MKCDYCMKEVKPDCDWQQGRCPYRQPVLDSILLDNYKTRYYNLINSLNNLFKGIAGKWQQRKKNKN